MIWLCDSPWNAVATQWFDFTENTQIVDDELYHSITNLKVLEKSSSSPVFLRFSKKKNRHDIHFEAVPLKAFGNLNFPKISKEL